MASSKNILILSLVCAAMLPLARTQTMKAGDITKEPTLYVVPYAHLDTQWRWEFPQTISEYLLKTMRVNFDYMEKYPHYVFNWTGSNRYRLMKEYFPSDYAKMKQYVAAGRWFPAGSSVEEGDVNLPTAEGILRQILYGNAYYRKEFGKASAEYMLPDCFGFPASLPTILAHAGVKGFSTQKLNANWQPAPRVGGAGSPEQTPEGIPFNVGVWEGVDGETIIAALNPSSYTSPIRSDLSKPPAAATNGRNRNQEPDWVARIRLDGKVTGVFADYHYAGTGDIGGAFDEESAKWLETMVTEADKGPVHVISAAADQMFLDIRPEWTSRMPRYKGDLELINHSAGSLTSQAYHKRWNWENEILADAAEKASVAAAWMGGRPYPQQRLNDAWTLVLGGQFHDTAAGTATPRAYEFAQNDDVIAMNQFAGVLTSATEAVTSVMNTQGRGTPIVVYNPLSIAREDLVEASVSFAGGQPKAVSVTGPDGRQVPAQLEDGKVLFLAHVPAVGYAVYDVQPAGGAPAQSALKVTESTLENARYRVQLNAAGDVASIFDKSLNKELLSAPMRLALSSDNPIVYPAWNMEFSQEQAAPRAYVGGPAKVRIAENGPVRVALEVSRETEGSKFVQTVRLSAGDAGNRVEFTEAIDWKSLAANLKAVFPLAAGNPNATYNWDIGTVERPNAEERQFEVCTHNWIDLTDAGGAFGTTILTDVKNGSDKRDDHTIRLTLIRTPGAPPPDSGRRPSYTDQYNQDWGHHEILFGLVGHANGWREAQTDWQAYRLNTPLMAFETGKHAGALGRTFSLATVSNPRIRMLALKKAEASDDLIVRLVEMDGKTASGVEVKFAGPIVAAQEVNAQELEPRAATVQGGALETSFTPYQPRTFRVHLGPAAVHAQAVQSQAVALKYDLAAASNDDTKSARGFDAAGDALPAEMLPAELGFNGVKFQLAAAGTGKPDALIAKGQTIALPSGSFNRVYVVAAAEDGDQNVTFKAGDRAVNLVVEDWGGFVGQWDTRIWKAAADSAQPRPNQPKVALRKDWAVSANHATWDLGYRGSPYVSPSYPADYEGLRPGYIKRADIAWYASHHHTPQGLNQPYAYSYLFVYGMDLPAGAKTVTLPDNEKVRILAISAARENPVVSPAQPLYDVLGGR
jgi:alpha-mannosidase